MIAAIVIGSVVAYAVVGCVAAGYEYEISSKSADSDDVLPSAVMIGFLWPLAGACWLLWKMATGPIALGRRIAAPRPSLPEARVVRGLAGPTDERGAGR